MEEQLHLQTLLEKMNKIRIPKKPFPSPLLYLGIPMVLLFTNYSYNKIGFSFKDFQRNLDNRHIVTDPLFNPKWSWAIENTASPMIETVQIAILASLIGCFVALPISFFASKTTNPSRLTFLLNKSFLNLIRTIPDLFWGMLFVAAVSQGPFAGVLALTMFSLAIMGKLLSETIDSIDVGPLEAARSTGATQQQAVYSSALPQVMPNFLSYFLYIFELCIRASIILGLVGAGGVGRIIETQRIFLRFDRISPIIVFILLIVIFIEQISIYIRRKVL